MHTRFKNSTLLAGVGAMVAVGLGATLVGMPAHSAGSTYGAQVPASKAHLKNVGDQKSAHAVLAGGCFWGMEEVFAHVKGVTNVVSGYAGGNKAHANYSDSSSGRYDDAEAIRITYDPSKISYAKLLQINFSVAQDPTQVNRQGPDVGTQYRSEVFAANADQARVARAYIKQLDAAHVFDRQIATKVSVSENFFRAEDYHQNYAANHPNSFYIRINDQPKVDALKSRFASLYSAQAARGNKVASVE